MSEQLTKSRTGIDIQTRIEEICEVLVLSDPSDFTAMSNLFNRFNGIHEWAQETDNQAIDSVITPVMQIMEKILLEEAEDLNAALAVVSDSVTALQSVVRDGHNIEEVDFPAELGLHGLTEAASKANGKIAALPPGVDEEIFTEFLSQQDGVLGEMETLVLSLEESNGNGSSSDLLRLLHTLKGESALMGLDDVEKLCHRTEDYLNVEQNDSPVDVLLSVKDWLQNKFTSFSSDTEVSSIQLILDKLTVSENGSHGAKQTSTEPVVETLTPTESSDTTTPTAEAQSDPKNEVWDIDMELCAEFVAEGNDHLEESDAQLLILEADPTDSDALNTVFRAFHTMKGVAGFLALNEIGSLAHNAENLLAQARRGKVALKGAAMDITFEALDLLKKMLDSVAHALTTGIAPAPEPALPSMVERLAILGNPDGSPAAAPAQAKASECDEKTSDKPAPKPADLPSKSTKPEQGVSSGTSSDAPSVKAPSVAKTTTPHKATKLKETLKVDAARLDQLVDAIGELVIAESMVSQSEELVNRASPNLVKHLSQLDKITRELQSMGTSLRMVTVRSVFQKMARLVRDLSKKSGKEIQFSMVGADTEVDKTVVDKIGDPLIHMIRNAVDHGIENSADDREKAGKPREGQIELRAFHKGGNIYIEVEDDGGGLNREAILSKAVERGLVKPDQKLSDKSNGNFGSRRGHGCRQAQHRVSAGVD